MRQRMQETLYPQTGDAGDTLSDSGCNRHPMRLVMLYPQTGDAGDTLWDSDAGDTLWDSRCRRHSIRQEMQETLYQTEDAGHNL